MIEVTECANETEKQLSLGVYNAVWPHDAVTMDEVSVYEAGALGYADLIARVDGRVAGSAHGALTPQRPDEVRVLLTVLDDARGRGAGSALYERISDWARERGIESLEATVADDDPESLTFAQRRGFVEHKREGGLVLDLTRRLAQANPGLTDPAADAGAIVLIDEIDLHLHPRWQMTVVETVAKTLPRMQFIFTSHSPLVTCLISFPSAV